MKSVTLQGQLEELPTVLNHPFLLYELYTYYLNPVISIKEVSILLPFLVPNLANYVFEFALGTCHGFVVYHNDDNNLVADEGTDDAQPYPPRGECPPSEGIRRRNAFTSN